MAYTPAQLTALSTEIKTDPAGIGYAGKSHEQIAVILSIENRQADRETLDAGLLVASIVRTEHGALTANDKDYVRLIAAAQSMPLTANLKTQLGGVFGAGTTTRANLLALMKRPGSRTDELGLPRATTSDVADALKLP